MAVLATRLPKDQAQERGCLTPNTREICSDEENDVEALHGTYVMGIDEAAAFI